MPEGREQGVRYKEQEAVGGGGERGSTASLHPGEPGPLAGECGLRDGEQSVMRVVVVGAGAFGRNHLRVYRELEVAGYPVELAAVIDPDAGARGRAEADFGVRGYASVAECLMGEGGGAGFVDPTHAQNARMNGAPGVGDAGFVDPTLSDEAAKDGAPGVGGSVGGDAGVLRSAQNDKQRGGLRGISAASVCVSTVHHLACARELMAAGVDVLIEKPLAATLAEADEIVALSQKLGRVVQVGHLERFNPAVRAVRGLLNKPMFFEVHRMSVFTPRSLDVDVVLDLMIHDLDIVMNLVGVPVREVRAVGLPVLSNKVDIANVRLEFENGCVANFTASRVSTERVRKMRFFQPRQYLSLDFARQDLLVIDVTGADLGKIAAKMLDSTLRDEAAKDGAPGVLGVGKSSTADGQRVGEHPSGGMEMRKVAVEAGEPLRLEIEAFLEAVRTRREPEVTVEDGRAALGLALEINAAIASHARRTGL
ncbi:MAG TPA: Gfo/Idh/MocA family oxidoreductase [Acidobacteriaceae bacterium]|nr:Gfo/Idh/MocA family oxidoreductase [Acidobacteriaceae bacterium]